VYKGGFVATDDLRAEVSRLSTKTDADFKDIAEFSTSKTAARTKKRFEVLEYRNHLYIRASYYHSFSVDDGDDLPEDHTQANGKNKKSSGPRSLVDLTLNCIAQNIKMFGALGDLDGYLLHRLLARLKITNKLNNGILKMFLVENLDVLDLDGVLIGDSIIRLIGQQCTALQHLNLSSCINVNDNSVNFLAKRCTNLKSLTLDNCKYITDQALRQLGIHCTNLTALSLRNVETLTDKGTGFLTSLGKLQTVDMKGCAISAAAVQQMNALCERSMNKPPKH